MASTVGSQLTRRGPAPAPAQISSQVSERRVPSLVLLCPYTAAAPLTSHHTRDPATEGPEWTQAICHGETRPARRSPFRDVVVLYPPAFQHQVHHRQTLWVDFLLSRNHLSQGLARPTVCPRRHMHAFLFLYFEFPGLEPNPSSIGRTWKPDEIAGGDSSQRRNDDSSLLPRILLHTHRD